MNKELEESLNIMKRWIKYEKENKDKINKSDELIKIQETIVNYIENSIPKEKHKKLKEHCKTLIKEKQELTSALLDSIPREKVEKELQELKNMKVDGEVFTTSVNFAIKVLEELLEGK